MSKPLKTAAVFFNVDFRNCHRGLSGLLEDHEVKSSDIVLFFNTALTGVKGLINGNTMIYHKAARITLNDVRNLPTLFGGERLHIPRDLLKKICDELEIRLRNIA
jgi:hypothetical protein